MVSNDNWRLLRESRFRNDAFVTFGLKIIPSLRKRIESYEDSEIASKVGDMLYWIEKSIGSFPRPVVAMDKSLGVGQEPKYANYLRIDIHGPTIQCYVPVLHSFYPRGDVLQPHKNLAALWPTRVSLLINIQAWKCKCKFQSLFVFFSCGEFILLVHR